MHRALGILDMPENQEVQMLPRPNLCGSKSNRRLPRAPDELETKEQLIQFLDELNKKLTEGLGTTVTDYGNAISNNSASFGYWLAFQCYSDDALLYPRYMYTQDSSCSHRKVRIAHF